MSLKSQKTVQGVTLVAACAALVLTAINIREYPQQMRRIERRQQTLAELVAIEQQQLEREEILTLYEHAETAKRQDVQPLLTQYQTEGHTVITPLFAGWELEETTWRAQNIELSTLSRLFEGLRELQPPWAVQSCRIVAKTEGGKGDVTLTVQTIFRP
jgi:hypothetical protein